MKEYKVVAFDLDGTLIDPRSGLVESFAYALDKMGIDYRDKASLTRFIGPPLFSEWQRLYALSYEEASKALDLFHEYYSVYGWWDNFLYPGVEEMLKDLKARGKRIVITTSKPEFFAKKIIDRLGLNDYFDFIGAALNDKVRDKKEEVIRYALSEIGGPPLEECILVGDRVFDAEGARAVGIDSLGVTYGYGSPEEISSSGFTYVANTVSDIAKML